jgi:hypothetical protein
MRLADPAIGEICGVKGGGASARRATKEMRYARLSLWAKNMTFEWITLELKCDVFQK